VPLADNFDGYEGDAQRDKRLHRSRRHMHISQRRERKRDAVRNRERSHRLDQQPNAARDDKQCQHKQKMINTKQNVFDAKLEIEPGHRPATVKQRDRC
jgi:hypothetical protein